MNCCSSRVCACVCSNVKKSKERGKRKNSSFSFPFKSKQTTILRVYRAKNVCASLCSQITYIYRVRNSCLLYIEGMLAFNFFDEMLVRKES